MAHLLTLSVKSGFQPFDKWPGAVHNDKHIEICEKIRPASRVGTEDADPKNIRPPPESFDQRFQ